MVLGGIIPPAYNPNITDIYSFAVYVFFPAAIVVFLSGIIYEALRLVLAWRRKRWLPELENIGVARLLVLFAKGYYHALTEPTLQGLKRRKRDILIGTLALHFLGVIPLIFLHANHVAFYAWYFPPYGLLWSLAIPPSSTTGSLVVLAPVEPVSQFSYTFHDSIWGPLTVVLNGDVVMTLATIAVAFKIGEKLVGLYGGETRPSDLLMLLLLLAILVTGFLAASHSSPSGETLNIVEYRTILGIHIILAGLFLALLPFTKYKHFILMWIGKAIEAVELEVVRSSGGGSRGGHGSA